MPDLFDNLVALVALPVSLIFLLNGLDDLFIDLSFYLGGLWRKSRIRVEDLKARPPQRVAVLIAAWRESAVIEHMLENALATLDYDPAFFDLFVGTYVNDPETQACVDAVAARVPNVTKVVVPHDGPTSKADCLNWIYQGLVLAEQRRGIRYDILVLHDSEDVVHPLELRLHNYYIPEYDFVQTPVLPLEVPWYSLAGGTYLDDFTENHLKDMIVRGYLGGLVPSAGVGSGFARDAFEEIALAHRQEAFDPSSLTEDYEIGVKFRLAGKKMLFATEAIARTREETDARGRRWQVQSEEYIATREFFPTRPAATVRQRSRWMLGIEFQTWSKVGWAGALAVRYCLWRDRKGLLGHVTNMTGYAIVLYSLGRAAASALTHGGWSFARVFPTGSLLWWLLLVNMAFMLWRITVRYVTVEKVYGPLHALMSVLRTPVGNVINFVALLRAARQWRRHRRTGQPLRWASTAHTFPTTNALSAYRKRLGELLQEREGLTRAALDHALELQKHAGGKLGELLALEGAISSAALTRALAAQWSIPYLEPTWNGASPALLAKLPESEAAALGVLPLSADDAGVATVVVERPLAAEQKTALEERLGLRIKLACAPPALLRRARELAYDALSAAAATAAEGTVVSSAEVAPDELPVSPGGLHPREVDVAALAALEYGPCALRAVLPLRARTAGGERVVAAAFAVHDETRRWLAARLGAPVCVRIVPALELRLALHLAARAAWPAGLAAGVHGADGAELRAARDALGFAPEVLEDVAAAAQDAALGPAEFLRRAALVSAREHAALLERAYQLTPADVALPAGQSHALIDVADGAVVAVAHPRPELSWRIAALRPDRAIAWRLADERAAHQEAHHELAREHALATTA